METHETIAAYFAAVRDGDVEPLMALFADDAIFTLPSGTSFTGKGAIRAAFEGVFVTSSPSPNVIENFTAADHAAVRVEAELPDGTVRKTANFYRFDRDGRITGLTIYAQEG